jgi:hypothetical protein
MRINHLLERTVQPGADGHHLPEVERCVLDLCDLSNGNRIGSNGGIAVCVHQQPLTGDRPGAVAGQVEVGMIGES